MVRPPTTGDSSSGAVLVVVVTAILPPGTWSTHYTAGRPSAGGAGDPLEGDGRRARDADRVAERRLLAPERPLASAHRLGLDELAHRSEQALALAAHPPSDDDDLWLEQVRDRDDPRRERLAGLRPDPRGG